MPIVAHDMLTLLVQEIHQPLVLGLEIPPERQFRLQIHPQFVGSLKGSLWRAP